MKCEGNVWEFIHLTFQEYFAAAFLANLYISSGKPKKEKKKQLKKAKRYLREIKFDPRYMLIIEMCAGILSSKGHHKALRTFFTDLTAEPKDLATGFELCLLGKCFEQCQDLTIISDFYSAFITQCEDFRGNMNPVESFKLINPVSSSNQLPRLNKRNSSSKQIYLLLDQLKKGRTLEYRDALMLRNMLEKINYNNHTRSIALFALIEFSRHRIDINTIVTLINVTKEKEGFPTEIIDRLITRMLRPNFLGSSELADETSYENDKKVQDAMDRIAKECLLAERWINDLIAIVKDSQMNLNAREFAIDLLIYQSEKNEALSVKIFRKFSDLAHPPLSQSNQQLIFHILFRISDDFSRGYRTAIIHCQFMRIFISLIEQSRSWNTDIQSCFKKKMSGEFPHGMIEELLNLVSNPSPQISSRAQYFLQGIKQKIEHVPFEIVPYLSRAVLCSESSKLLKIHAGSILIKMIGRMESMSPEVIEALVELLRNDDLGSSNKGLLGCNLVEIASKIESIPKAMIRILIDVINSDSLDYKIIKNIKVSLVELARTRLDIKFEIVEHLINVIKEGDWWLYGLLIDLFKVRKDLHQQAIPLLREMISPSITSRAFFTISSNVDSSVNSPIVEEAGNDEAIAGEILKEARHGEWKNNHLVLTNEEIEGQKFNKLKVLGYDELVWRIFSFLDEKTFFKAVPFVCKRWNIQHNNYIQRYILKFFNKQKIKNNTNGLVVSSLVFSSEKASSSTSSTEEEFTELSTFDETVKRTSSCTKNVAALALGLLGEDDKENFSRGIDVLLESIADIKAIDLSPSSSSSLPSSNNDSNLQQALFALRALSEIGRADIAIPIDAIHSLTAIIESPNVDNGYLKVGAARAFALFRKNGEEIYLRGIKELVSISQTQHKSSISAIACLEELGTAEEYFAIRQLVEGLGEIIEKSEQNNSKSRAISALREIVKARIPFIPSVEGDSLIDGFVDQIEDPQTDEINKKILVTVLGKLAEKKSLNAIDTLGVLVSLGRDSSANNFLKEVIKELLSMVVLTEKKIPTSAVDFLVFVIEDIPHHTEDIIKMLESQEKKEGPVSVAAIQGLAILAKNEQLSEPLRLKALQALGKIIGLEYQKVEVIFQLLVEIACLQTKDGTLEIHAAMYASMISLYKGFELPFKVINPLIIELNRPNGITWDTKEMIVCQLTILAQRSENESNIAIRALAQFIANPSLQGYDSYRFKVDAIDNLCIVAKKGKVFPADAIIILLETMMTTSFTSRYDDQDRLILLLGAIANQGGENGVRALNALNDASKARGGWKSTISAFCSITPKGLIDLIKSEASCEFVLEICYRTNKAFYIKNDNEGHSVLYISDYHQKESTIIPSDKAEALKSNTLDLP